jgi:GNAT superfamily N-acetyltransferase
MTRHMLTLPIGRGCVDVQTAGAFAALADAGDLYPGFEAWYWDTVVSGLGRDRAIFVEWISEKIAGVVIAKRTFEERKLCTVWVDEHLRNRGVASRLIDRSCSWLETNSPMLTIPSERLGEFTGILKSRQFRQTQVLDAYYRPGSREHVFNGRLPLIPQVHASVA